MKTKLIILGLASIISLAAGLMLGISIGNRKEQNAKEAFLNERRRAVEAEVVSANRAEEIARLTQLLSDCQKRPTTVHAKRYKSRGLGDGNE